MSRLVLVAFWNPLDVLLAAAIVLASLALVDPVKRAGKAVLCRI